MEKEFNLKIHGDCCEKINIRNIRIYACTHVESLLKTLLHDLEKNVILCNITDPIQSKIHIFITLNIIKNYNFMKFLNYYSESYNSCRGVRVYIHLNKAESDYVRKNISTYKILSNIYLIYSKEHNTKTTYSKGGNNIITIYSNDKDINISYENINH